MTRNPRRIHGDDHVGDAVVLMESGRSQISVLPVVDGDAVLGLLRLHDTYSHSG
jgi:CBS domain-containing protein